MPHRFNFVRLGGFDQVCLDSGADLAALPALDAKLWAALSCPTRGLDLDGRTLELIDTDGDGRIRAPELLAALRWTLDRLRDPDTLAKGADPLPLDAIRADSPEGALLLRTAHAMLQTLGKTTAESISVAEAVEAVTRFAATPWNGDGVITEGAAPDAAAAARLSRIIATHGDAIDRSGRPGLGADGIAKFHADAAAFLAWHEQGRSDPAIRPLGDATPAAAEALRAVRAKVEDYFTRCRLAAYDARAAAALDAAPAVYAKLAERDLTGTAPELAALPLAHIAPGQPLPLRAGINPAWVAAVSRLRDVAARPLLGEREALTDADWADLVARLAPYEAWLAGQPTRAFDPSGADALRTLQSESPEADLLALVERDRARDPEFQALTEVERLVRYARDLPVLVNNFVTLRPFYSGRPAVFQAGTLYLDGRSCDLTLRVDDPAAHAGFAGASGIYLAYCECRRKTCAPMTIAAAFTDGDADFLAVGRNGLFVDRKGRDWDATVVRIVDQPISIRQAFFAPYKKLAALVEELVSKFAATHDKAGEAAAAQGIAAVSAPPDPAKPAPVFDVARFTGVLAAAGLAIGAIGTALASVVTGLFGLGPWQLPLALAGILLVVSGPSMLLAWLKLRNRSLAPVLDACGWAINTRARINLPFGRSLTSLARLPEGSGRTLTDPYAEPRSLWPWLLLATLAILLLLGFAVHRPGGLFHRFMKRDSPPAATAAARPAPVPAPKILQEPAPPPPAGTR